MSEEPKFKSVRLIRELRGLGVDDIDYGDVLDIEERLSKIAQREHTLRLVSWLAFFITLSVLILLLLQALGIGRLSGGVVVILALEVPVAVVGYVGMVVRHFWGGNSP